MSNQWTEGNVKAFTAAEALQASRRVKLDASGNVVYADKDDDCIGTTEAYCANTYQASIRLKSASGTRLCTASGAVSIGDVLYGDDDGKVTATPNGIGFGVAIEAATADGDYIEVML